jgi:hypothetical protein
MRSASHIAIQVERDGDSDQKEWPNQKDVEVDHSHACEQQSNASDQK